MVKERNISKWISCVIVTIMTLLILSCCTNNTNNNNSSEVDSFAFKGEAIDHPANFDKDTIVTTENIESLYRKFKLDTLFNGDYYLVRSKKYFKTSRYLSRLIQMKDGKQVAAKTFYDSETEPNNILRLGNRLIVGLNSLRENYYELTFHHTSHKCRILVLTDSLTLITGKQYYSNEGHTYIESLLQNSDTTFYCSIASGKVEADPLLHYQFCANNCFNIKSYVAFSRYNNTYQIASENIDLSKPDWGNDISDMELLKMRKDAEKKDSILSNSQSFEEQDSTKRVAIESQKICIPNERQSIPKDFVLVPSGLLNKREWSNKNQNYYYKDVKMDSFYISKYELTQIQYEKIMGVLNPEQYTFIIDPYYLKKKKNKGDDIPVNCTYVEFVNYCNQRSQKEGYDGFYEINGNQVSFKKNGNGYRLLFEEEWIHAAKGGKNEKFRYVGSNSLKEVAWYGNNSGNLPHPVGQKKANSLGIYDMSGNISEMLETTSKPDRGYHVEAGNDYLSWISSGEEFSAESTGYYYTDKKRRTGTRLVFVPKKNRD